jgi:YD repeat-containing protein
LPLGRRIQASRLWAFPAYDNNGMLRETKDPLGNRTTNVYDLQQRLKATPGATAGLSQSCSAHALQCLAIVDLVRRECSREAVRLPASVRL